ncbi:MAG TPA: hypothetical protein VLT33_37650 [Labilithrix sp.]|nr:hypothetical protein [Labilithrix sp.]
MKLRSAAPWALVALALAACDPVHDDAQAALGGEAPGVRTGPLHRPGQPCTVCHDGKLGSPPEFSVAGTIFRDQADRVPLPKATVTLTGADGASFAAITNAAGNFYVEPGRFTPRYPMKTEVSYGGVTIKMTSLIGRAGACAGCHVDPAGPTSPGHVFVPADGVIP